MKLRTIVTFALGPVGTAALGLLTMPLMAWIFSSDDIGRFNVVQTVTPLLVTGIFLGLDQAYVREFHEASDRKQLHTTVLATALLVYAVVCLPFCLFPTWSAERLYGLASPWLTWVTLLSVLLALLLRQWMLVARMNERSLSFSLAQLSPKIVLLLGLGSALAARATPDFGVLLEMLVLSNLVGVLVLGVALWRHICPRRITRDSLGFLVRMLRYSLPLALASFVYVALSSVSTFALRYLASFQELGVFAISLSIATAAGLIQQIFSIIWSPIVYKALAGGDVHATVARMRSIVVALFGVTLALAGILSWLIDFFLPAQYADAKYMVVGLTFAPLVYMVREVTGIGMLITRRTGFPVVGNMLALVIMVSLCIWLIPLWGSSGAVIASILTFWFVFIFNTEVSARIWWDFNRVGLHVIVATGALLSLMTLWAGSRNEFWYVLLWVVFGVVIVVTNKWALLDALPGRGRR